MKIVHTKCSLETVENCIRDIKTIHPEIISILHTNNEHLCFSQDDYTEKGEIKKVEYEKIKNDIKEEKNKLIATKEFV